MAYSRILFIWYNGYEQVKSKIDLSNLHHVYITFNINIIIVCYPYLYDVFPVSL